MRWIVFVVASLLLGVFGWNRPAKPAWELKCKSASGTCSVVGFNAQDQLIALQHLDDSEDVLCVYDKTGVLAKEYPHKGVHYGTGFLLPDDTTVMIISHQIQEFRLDFVSWKNGTTSHPSIPVRSAGNPRGSHDGRYLLVNPQWEKMGQFWMADLDHGHILFPVQKPMAFAIDSKHFVELEQSLDGAWAVFRRTDDGSVVNRLMLPQPDSNLRYATITWPAHNQIELHYEPQSERASPDKSVRTTATYSIENGAIKKLVSVRRQDELKIKGRISQQLIREFPNGVIRETFSNSIIDVEVIKNFLQRYLNIRLRTSHDGQTHCWERLTDSWEKSTHPIVFPNRERFALSDSAEYLAVGGNSLRFWKIEPNHQWRNAIAYGAIPFGIILVLIARRRRFGRLNPNSGSPAGEGTCHSL